MEQNVATLIFLLVTLTSSATANILREEEREEADSRFWGGDCRVDRDCLRLAVSDLQLQVSVCQSVCQSSREQCEPSAVLWVMAAFLAVLLILVGAVAALYFCNRKQNQQVL